MAYKKLGPEVSESPANADAGAGQYTADEHSFESVVFQQDKPVLDWELNLLQEILGQAGSRLMALKTLPSSVLNGDFLEQPDLGSYLFFDSGLGPDFANQFVIGATDLVVNGWPIRFEYTNSADPGQNIIVLPAPPGSGHRMDLVILEVWRALVSAAPSTLNKSPTGQILRNGNAKAGDQFPPGNANLADDILDPSMLQETQKRVQIQYRYRVIQNATIDSSNIDGLGTVLSRSVPYQNASGVDGEPPISPLPYISASSKSYGLWMAGNGNATSAAALGTVDGFMYAVPLCAVHRRNSGGFNETTNRNGALPLTAGTSDRPDGLFADQVVEGDVVDLRHGSVNDLNEILDKNLQYVFDNTLRSSGEVFTDGLSTVGGTSFLVGDDTGVDTQSMGNMDGVRAHFSDRRIVEPAVHVEAMDNSTNFTLHLNSLNLQWAPATDVVLNAPAGTKITGIGKIRLVDSVGSFDIDMLDPASNPKVTSINFISNTSVQIEFSAAIANGNCYVEVLVAYPPNVGLQRNVLSATALWTPDPSVIAPWAETLLFTPAVSPGRFTLPEGPGSPTGGKYWNVDTAHRELQVYIPAVAQTNIFFVNSNGTVMLPERVSFVNVVGDPGFVVIQFVYDGAYTVVTFDAPPVAGTAVQLQYAPFRAPPPTADHYTLWYQSRAIQSVLPPSGTWTLNLVPRCFSKVMHVITNGSGSPDDGFPFDAVGAQIPIPSQPPGSHPEATMDSPNNVSVLGFGMNSGYVQVPVLMPYSPDPGQVTLFRNAVDGVLDGDNRPFWPKSDNGSEPVYAPTIFGQALAIPTRHKVTYPVLCELKEDFNGIGQKGTLVLVVFCSWSEISTVDGVTMATFPNDSGAAVFKLKGGFLNTRRSDT